MLHRHAGAAVAAGYTTGAIAGGLTTSAALLVVGGLVSPIPLVVRATVAVAGLALLLLRQVGLVTVALPQRAYQIPRETFHDRPVDAAARFAYELGTGVRTYVSSSAPYGLLLVATLTPATSLARAIAEAAALGIGFGIGRSIVVAGQAVRRRVVVEPPGRSLDAAALVSLAVALMIAISRAG